MALNSLPRGARSLGGLHLPFLMLCLELLATIFSHLVIVWFVDVLYANDAGNVA